MKRNLFLPAGIAAGLHAFLLLGFRSAPDPAPPAPQVDRLEVSRFQIPPDPPELPKLLRSGVQPPPVPPPIMPPPSEPREPYRIEPPDDGHPCFIVPPTRPYVPDRQAGSIPAMSPQGGGKGWGDVIDRDWLDNDPRVLFRPAPVPSRDLAAAATVTVEFVVGRDGRVVDAQVVESTDPGLEEACARAVRRWRFEPGKKHGQPVAFRVRQAFVFHPAE